MEIEYISHTRLFFCLLGPFTYHVAIFEKSWKKLEGRTGFFWILKGRIYYCAPYFNYQKISPLSQQIR